MLMLSAAPVFAVFNEKNISITLEVLHAELAQETEKALKVQALTDMVRRNQRHQMTEMLKRCNELSLMLYSQKPGYTFDMTYAFDEVTKEYEKYNKERMPYDKLLESVNSEIDKYERLLEALRRIPPMLEEIEEVPDSLKAATDSLVLGGRPEAGRDRPAFREFRKRSQERSDRKQPFLLDSAGCIARDTCVFYAINLLKICVDQKNDLTRDSEYYESTNNRLKESFDYALQSYRNVQTGIFNDGQRNYFSILKYFGSYLDEAVNEARSKYGRGDESDYAGLHQSEWRGPVVGGFIFFIILHLLLATGLSRLVYVLLSRRMKTGFGKWMNDRKPAVILFLAVAIFLTTFYVVALLTDISFLRIASRLVLIYSWLLAAIVFSLLARLDGEHIGQGLKSYIPIAVVGLLVITFRIIFLPDMILSLILPPVLLICSVWQFIICRKRRSRLRRSDYVCNCITMGIFFVATVMAWAGYVFMGVQVLIWWLFQLAAVQSVIAIYTLLQLYNDTKVLREMERYGRSNIVIDKGNRGSYIEVLWLFNFIRNVALPILAIISVPYCIYMAADVFNLSSAFNTIFHKPFLSLDSASGSEILRLSIFKLVLVCSLFYVFRYFNDTIKALYKLYRYRKLMDAEGRKFVRANEVNLTLANNIISILIWGGYIIMAILMLRIPMGAISIVAAGLATGIGLALKDVLNNFIYGIQLMSGRARVGDYIECDGIRGKVESISYQSTQILTGDEAIMSFTNSALFNKNFKNLTKNNAYELVKIIVGVGYGSDIQSVRDIVLEAVKSMAKEDKYGRSTIDPKKGIAVTFEGFGESSVNLAVKAYVLVEERFSFVSGANELIYNALGEHNVEIPFPQRDVHIR